MTRLANAVLAVVSVVCLGAFAATALSAQDEKKTKRPGKKPPLEEMEKDGGKKGKRDAAKDKDDAKKDKEEASEKKDEDKSDADKPREPADEKQKRQFDKIRIDIERKFKKSKREQVFVYATSERTMERVEPSEEAPPAQTVQRGRTPPRGAGSAGAGYWEPIVKNTAYLTKDRDDAVEKVYKFLVEYPPPAPGAKKKRKSKDEVEEPPPPMRALLSVQVFAATKEGERQAEAALEQLENKFIKEQRQIEAKKQARMKGKN